MDQDLKRAFGECSFKGHESRLVIACSSEHTDNNCGVCSIMDYAEIDQVPVVFFFKNGVLKDRVLGFQAIMNLVQQEKLEDYARLINERGQRGRLANDLIFHFMNVMTLWSFSVNLRDLWHAQGFNVIVRRNTKNAPDSWNRFFERKKDEWRAIGIMVSRSRIE
ncbi:hypothetical protein PILCRDRAFT_534588 [Piloderma croceum F 1598]|uniref:Uncharacterized protein n=1 Tax=Piloderma croceum (strain F 1598) TaxID=765440 RepID=A0A0C3FLT1_PILCF|nr:hypothetical protein PILCRDRAFT_534588 [Piloderma croceum F 1598]